MLKNKIMKHTLTLVLISAIFITTTQCSKEKAAAPTVLDTSCDSIPKSFSVDVLPIFTANCVTCHNAANNVANGQNWETHAEITANLSMILTAINHEGGAEPMPYQMPKLSDSLIQVIECWASDGAPNN